MICLKNLNETLVNIENIENDYDLLNIEPHFINTPNIEINGKMTADEILKSIQDLKTQKACGDDNIINENIKSSAHLLIPIYVRLFNCTFDSGKVPCTWLSLGFELMTIGIKANTFSMLYIVNKRHDTTEHTNQQL